MMSLPFVLAGAWIAYSAVALRVSPVSNHDALSYHFPKAVRLATSGAFALYPSRDQGAAFFPGNYEMLVATFMTFLRSDTATGLVTSASLLLFAATAMALFRRVWRDRAPAALALAMLFGSSFLLLHATAHENDILMAAVTLNALVWLGRFAARGGRGSGVIGLTCVSLAAGIKFHGLFLVLASGVLLWRAWRDGRWQPTPREAGLQLAGAATLFALLGGVQYNCQSRDDRASFRHRTVSHRERNERCGVPGLFSGAAVPMDVPGCAFPDRRAILPRRALEWRNLVLAGVQLSFSHYGGHITVLILLLPVGIRWARRELDATARSELAGVSRLSWSSF